MSSNKLHPQVGDLNIPFSWENKPGVSKSTPPDSPAEAAHFTGKLPPPPCQPVKASLHQHLKIPLPPCVFQSPLRSSFRRGLRKQDDPFLLAYQECTKSTNKGKANRDEVGFGIILKKSSMSFFSCKHSCSVRDDSIVRISQLPISKSHREKEEGAKEREWWIHS